MPANTKYFIDMTNKDNKNAYMWRSCTIDEGEETRIGTFVGFAHNEEAIYALIIIEPNPGKLGVSTLEYINIFKHIITFL